TPKPISGLSVVPKPTQVQSQPGPVKMISEFTAKIGGADAVKRITGYEIRGRSTAQTGDSVGEFYAAKSPENFMRIYQSPGLGKVQEIWSGNNYSLQTDVGMEQK